MPEQRLLLLGFGNVGQWLARLLLRHGAALAREHGIAFRITGIATGRHGVVCNPAGIDAGAALQLAAAGAQLGALPGVQSLADPAALLAAGAGDVLFENSPQNAHSGQPALDYIRTALQNGMHVITANKGPLVHGYAALKALAAAHKRRFLFESTVMDGTPIFSMARACLPLSRVTALRGVLNSTTNVILSQMEQGATFAAGVQYAQQLGVAEADPSADVDGWDAAVKVAAIATVLMDQPIAPAQMTVQGIRAVTPQQAQAARAAGTPLKLLCTAAMVDGRVQAAVQPTPISFADPLAHLTGTSSGVTLTFDTMKEIYVAGMNHGPEQTAFGLLADFVNALR